MITEHDLEEAIKACEGTTNPSAGTCIKLASFYAILDRMRGTTPTMQEIGPMIRTSYSMSSGLDSEFARIAESKGIENVFPIIDELMETISVINPKLYDSVIRKIEKL